MNPLAWAKSELLHLAWKRGYYTPPDRKLFQMEILPLLASEPENKQILSVGVAWYTSGYESIFAGKTFATMDRDPSRSSFGSALHITGDLRDLERLFDKPFDVILMNGVIGYGLNDLESVDTALHACAARLRAGGTLVVGLNEEKTTNVDPFTVPAHALFEPRALGRFEEGRIMVSVPFRERTHTFLFWRRR
jgi:hypothetical protein